MMRSITYRAAGNVFIFLALWLFIGAVLLWSPVPGALGIGSEFFGVWVVLLFLITGLGGAMLTIAAINTAFPGDPGAARTHASRARSIPRTKKAPGLPPRSDDEPMWAPPPRPSPPQRES